MGAEGEEDDGFFLGVGLVGEEGNIAIGVLAVDDFGARRAGDPQAFQACREAPIGADGDGGADTPDVSPPRAAGCRAQDGLFFLSGVASGGIRGAADFPVDFLGIAMVPEGGEQGSVGERRAGSRRRVRRTGCGPARVFRRRRMRKVLPCERRPASRGLTGHRADGVTADNVFHPRQDGTKNLGQRPRSACRRGLLAHCSPLLAARHFTFRPAGGGGA